MIPVQTTPITWFGGHVGVMRVTEWTLHLLSDDGRTFCGRGITRLVSAKEANHPKCRWCETCLRDAQNRMVKPNLGVSAMAAAAVNPRVNCRLADSYWCKRL